MIATAEPARSGYGKLLGLLEDELRQPVEPSVVDRLREDPAYGLRKLGMEPDSWQDGLLRSDARQSLVCCSRQSGKSRTAAALALNTALLQPGSLTLLVSRAQRQSAELLRKVKEIHQALRGGDADGAGRNGRARRPFRPLPLKQWQAMEARYEASEAPERSTVRDSVLSVEFGNGSRIISLPGKPDPIVGYSSVTLLIIDEAARTGDELYYALRPFLAVSRGRLVALSTPQGKRGWFYADWVRCEDAERKGLPPSWRRVLVTAEQCPRITPEFLAEEKAEIGPRWWRQEYFCSFEDTVDSVFAGDDIRGCVSADVKPLFP
jgi:hypothetical protein